MSSFHYSGAGSPTSDEEFTGFIDAGAGAPTSHTGFATAPLALGAGDPYMLSDITFLLDLSYGGVWGPDSSEWTPTRQPDPTWLSQEGGTLVQLNSMGQPLPAGPYRIDFEDAAGQLHPILEPGAYSSIQDQGSEVYPENAGLRLVCVMPPLPLGEYSIIVTDAVGETTRLYRCVLAVPMPDSAEVESFRSGIPYTVYPGAHPDRRR